MLRLGFGGDGARQNLPGRQFWEADLVVNGVTRSGVSSPTPRTRTGEGRPFGVKTEQAAQTDAAVATPGVAVASLLALQERESERQQDRAAKRHGDAVVEELTELQRALLGEHGADLDRLATLVARPITASDPALAGVLRALRLRASVELARRGRAASM